MRSSIDRRDAVLVGILVVMTALITLRAPVFLSAASLDTLITDGSILAMMALVQMLALITGGIDLSIAANMALVGMVTALLSRAHPDLPVALTVVLSLSLGLILGAFNGVLIAVVRMPPIVVTLGTMSLYRGAVFLVSGGAWVNAHEFGPGYLEFPTSRSLGLTHISWIAAAVILAAHVFLNHTARGRELYALGGNRSAARYVGISESWVAMRVYCLTGVISGLAGYLWVARYAVAYTETALGFELQTIAACVIGGVSTAGGKGRVLGCLLGATFLVLILNSLPMIDVSPFWQMAISGAAILAAVIVNSRGEAHLRGAARMTRSLVKHWEAVLVVLLIAICVVNSIASPYFLDVYNLFDSTQAFTEKAIVALSMTLVIIGRDIDLSVAAIIALCSTIIGWLATLGVGTVGLVAASLLVGTAAGAFNGFVITRFRIQAIVVTIGTMSLFRGISYAVLGDAAYTSYPDGFEVLGQGTLWGIVPYELLTFAVLAIACTVVLHRTVIGRRLFAYGNNPNAALYSGINVDAHRFWLFTINGTLSGLASVFLTSRIGATRPNIASGWELDVIAVVVLGGVSILGGSGTLPGVILSVFVLGMLTFGLALMNVPGIMMSIVTGLLLIVAIAAPLVIRRIVPRRV